MPKVRMATLFVIQTFGVVSAFVIRISSFLVHIALITLVALELLNVFVGLIETFATLLLYDFPQHRIDIFRHSLRVATHEEMGTLCVEPLPNLSGILPHLMLDINFFGLIA